MKYQKPFLLIGIITFILCLLPYVNGLELSNQTEINEYLSNSTIRLENTINLTALDINDTLQRILFYNISSNYSKITNINNTYINPYIYSNSSLPPCTLLEDSPFFQKIITNGTDLNLCNAGSWTCLTC